MEKTHIKSEEHEIPDLDMLINTKEARSGHEGIGVSDVPVTPAAPFIFHLSFNSIKKYVSSSNFTFMTIFGVVMVALIVFFGYRAYISYNSPQAQLLRTEKENNAMVERVRSLMLLPEGVSPIIYTIEDPAILVKEQSFFIGAERGDKLLLYPNMAKAVIYSPLRNIIINVGPVEFGASNINVEK